MKPAFTGKPSVPSPSAPPVVAHSRVTLTFTGTVVACETRFTSPVARAVSVHEPHANWILTIDVESADEGAPAAAGSYASFLIHSPSHTLLVAADDAPGHRFRFEIVREIANDQPRWSRLSGRELR